MLKKIGIAVVLLVAALAVVIATRPAAFRIERSATITAPVDVIYAHVSDFHQWEAWSPWAKLDPSMKTTFEGPASRVGSSYAWVGNSKVGEGKMTVKALTPSEVQIDLDFKTPMEAKNLTVFTFTPVPPAGGTQVTWTMTGENGFMGKGFALFMDMDKLVGADFERGLAALKTVSEADAKKKADDAKAVTAAAAAPAPVAAPPGAPATSAAPLAATGKH